MIVWRLYLRFLADFPVPVVVVGFFAEAVVVPVGVAEEAGAISRQHLLSRHGHAVLCACGPAADEEEKRQPG